MKNNFKKLINIAFSYVALALASGVFYREFTKYHNFTGNTGLSLLHVHLLVLGTFVYLILGLFSLNTDLLKQKKFNLFQGVYNSSLILMAAMILIKGILTVLGAELSKGMQGMIAGISGVAHIGLAVGFVMLYLILKNIKKVKGE